MTSCVSIPRTQATAHWLSVTPVLGGGGAGTGGSLEHSHCPASLTVPVNSRFRERLSQREGEEQPRQTPDSDLQVSHICTQHTGRHSHRRAYINLVIKGTIVLFFKTGDAHSDETSNSGWGDGSVGNMLACHHKDFSFDPQKHVKLNSVAHACSPSTPTTRWEADRRIPRKWQTK